MSEKPLDDEDDLIRFMRKHGFEITRENYVDFAYGIDLPDPWTWEHEADLTACIRLAPKPGGEAIPPSPRPSRGPASE
jgi:hypothetical protein